MLNQHHWLIRAVCADKTEDNSPPPHSVLRGGLCGSKRAVQVRRRRRRQRESGAWFRVLHDTTRVRRTSGAHQISVARSAGFKPPTTRLTRECDEGSRLKKSAARFLRTQQVYPSLSGARVVPDRNVPKPASSRDAAGPDDSAPPPRDSRPSRRSRPGCGALGRRLFAAGAEG